MPTWPSPWPEILRAWLHHVWCHLYAGGDLEKTPVDELWYYVEICAASM